MDAQAAALGPEVVALWQTIKEAAQREANRGMAKFTHAEFAPRDRAWQGQPAVPALWKHHQRGKAPAYGNPFLPHLPTWLDG